MIACTRLASFDWCAWISPQTLPPSTPASPSLALPQQTKPVEWSQLKHALLTHARGHGFGPFIADKGIQHLLLADLIPAATDGGELGPGALAAFAAYLNLLRGHGWRSAYKMKPSEVSAELVDHGLWLDFTKHFQPLFKTTVVAYWNARVRVSPSLSQLTKYIIGALDRDHPIMLIENMLCEFERRRAAALAWVRRIIHSLPKGRFPLTLFLKASEHRALKNLRFLVCDAAGHVTGEPLVNLSTER